jgi:UDP-glucose:(heptosyl)LPS alpha-1,3-glucosyltransferase
VLTLEARVFARTPRIVAIARRGMREIETLYGVSPSRIRVIYNGVDLERFHPRNRARDRAPARRETAIPADAFTVLFVGSGFARKGLATALEGLAASCDRQSRLLVLGKGDPTGYRALASRLGIGERIVWLGARDDPERWYAAADIVVLPSLYEPFGNVHLEALAAGLPVVASTRAGGAEVIADGINGAIVSPTDARAVAEALDRFRERPQGAVAELARRSAEPYTYAAQVSGFQRIYRKKQGATMDFS